MTPRTSTTFKTEISSSTEFLESDPIEAASNQLQAILIAYLDSRPHISLNGLSKRCAVSEPTLRRIRKGQLKTLPSVYNIMEILRYVSQKEEAKDILKHFGGPLEKYLDSKFPQINSIEKIEVSEHLTRALKDPVKYLIYKLSVNSEGVSLEKVIELFGSYGEKQLQAMMQERLVEKRGENYFGTVEYFALSGDVFIEHFKSTADFIKVNKVANSKKNHSPHFANSSTGLNKKGYSEILRIQRAALKKIRKVMSEKKFLGKIPTFYLSAIDTIDLKSADEFPEDN